MYVGQWKHNQPEGKGRLIHPDGEVYEGDWVKDEAHGKGTYYYADGSVYEGDWENDKKNGVGTETFIDKSKRRGKVSKNNGAKNIHSFVYTGTYKDGQR
jgi:hypothetical protein